MGLITETEGLYYKGSDNIQQSGDEDYGNYQFTSLDNVIRQFMAIYVGEDKLISKIKRSDVQFFAMRGLQELSFDTFKSIKSQEIELPANLKMVLPQDYVNYVKLAWIDSSGIEHIIYPTKYTSNPTKIDQATDGTYNFDASDLDNDGDTEDLKRTTTTTSTATTAASTTLTLAAANANILPGMLVSGTNITAGTFVASVSGTTVTLSQVGTGVSTGTYTFTSLNNDSATWDSYKSVSPAENTADDYEDDTYWPDRGGRYGLDPAHAQINGSYYIDDKAGIIHFSSNLSGKTIVLRYISDGVGTDEEMKVHKFAEEALYKWITYGIMSTRANTDQNIVARIKKERFAETRKAKLRLSNFKLEELTQVLRGKSKQIKH